MSRLVEVVALGSPMSKFQNRISILNRREFGGMTLLEKGSTLFHQGVFEKFGLPVVAALGGGIWLVEKDEFLGDQAGEVVTGD